jgi:parvulin-like peptidyl-prolyl isomerase
MKVFYRSTACRLPSMVLLGLIFLANAGARAGDSVNQPSVRPKEVELSKPVASVNGEKIWVIDLNKAISERIPETGHASVSEKRWAEIRREELEKLIGQEVLVQEARRLEIKVTPESIEAEVRKLQFRFPSKEEFLKAVKSQGLTLDEIRTGIERYLAIKQLSDQEVRSKISISDDQMKSYYDGHREQFRQPEQIRLRILLVGVDPSSLRDDWEKGRQKAQKLADRANKGENFEALVRQFSDDTEFKAKGGDTGLLHQGRLPYAELEPVVFAREVGSISEPVRTLYGFVVYRVEEKKPAQQMAFENLNKELLRTEMQESATQAKLKEWIDGLRSKAEVKIY